MRPESRGGASLRLIVGVVLALGVLCGPVCAQEQFLTAQGAIEVSVFTDPEARYGSDPDVAVKLSPDGKRFAVVTTRGLIESNEVESRLWVFDAKAARESLQAKGPQSLRPTVLVRRAEVTNEDVLISDLRWSGDSDAVLFLQRDAHGARGLYRASVLDGTVSAISTNNQNVDQFDAVGNTIVYTVTSPASQYEQERDIQRVVPGNSGAWVLNGLSIEDIVSPNSSLDRERLKWRELWMFRQGKASQVIDSLSGEPLRRLGRRPSDEVLALAPNARDVITVLPVAPKPEWESYQPLGQDLLDAYWTEIPHQYVLVELDSGKVTPLVNAPLGWFKGYFATTDAVWSSDGRKVLLTGTYLTLEGASVAERERRRLPCAATVVQLSSGKADCLMTESSDSDPNPEFVVSDSPRFGNSNREVTLRVFTHHGDTPRTLTYVENNGTWSLRNTSDDLRTRQLCGGCNLHDLGTGRRSLSVFVHQGLNEPPALFVSGFGSGRKKKIWDPNPQLAALNLGEVTALSWKDDSGYEWVAGLVKPPNHVRGGRYPLVIQTHGFNQGRFLTDGGYGTALAARPLASVGIVVLQMDLRERQGRLATPQEIPDQLRGFNSGVDYLTSQGIIDPSRVGIIGFSRTCFHVEGALIANPTRFAAATIADGTDVDYFQYLLSAQGSVAHDTEGERIYGAKPFGAGLREWINSAPGFNLDKVKTPLRIEVESGGALGVLSMWPRYASLALQHKPIDLIYFPDGVHVLQKPLERLVSQQGNVDWFRFWLQGYEDSDQKKAEQYQRWEKLCDVQVEQNSSQPAFCVRSKPH